MYITFLLFSVIAAFATACNAAEDLRTCATARLLAKNLSTIDADEHEYIESRGGITNLERSANRQLKWSFLVFIISIFLLLLAKYY